MQNVFIQYLAWQFFDAPKNILAAWKNFLKFGLNYFSLPFLIRTLFSPWRRYRWVYQKRGFDFGQFFSALFSNLIFRVLGMLMRSVLIIAGLFTEFFIMFAGLFVFLGWFILPILLILGLYHGFRILF